MLTVVCINVPGPGSYRPEHTYRLKDMVAHHLGEPFRFILIAQAQLPGWWAKVEMFSPGRFSGRILYLDLDVTVVGNLAPLAHFDAPFVACPDFIPTRRADGVRFKSPLNSSVMAWDAGAADHIYTNFTSDAMDRLYGDQDWIGEQMPDAAIFPEPLVYSYKAHKASGGIGVPKGASVCVFHGLPKPWDLPNEISAAA